MKELWYMEVLIDYKPHVIFNTEDTDWDMEGDNSEKVEDREKAIKMGAFIADIFGSDMYRIGKFVNGKMEQVEYYKLNRETDEFEFHYKQEITTLQ